MVLADEWLNSVLIARGESEPPPNPQIPADYLQKPRRHPASKQAPISSSLLPSPPTSFSRPKRSHDALLEIEPPNRERSLERRRTPNALASVMSQTPRSPSKRSSRVAARKAKDTNKGSVVENVVDPNATPRPVRVKGKSAPLPPARTGSIPNIDKTEMSTMTPSVSQGELEMFGYDIDRPASSVTESTGSKARSRSPTKRMVDLRIAEKTVALKTVISPADVPEDVRGIYKAIQSLARVPRGVIPLGIEDEVEKDAGGDLDDLDLFVTRKPNGMTGEQLMDEFKAIRGIRDSTAFCKTKHVHEPTWNERVHSRMLEQAVRGRAGFEYHNITTARVIRELVPGNRYGELLKNKMIDYAINLGPPLFSEDQVVTRLATSPPSLQRTINPSDYSPLCYNPVAISIETKSPDGSKDNGEVQLSIWAMAYFNRLRTLTQDPVSITLPLILISDEHGKLMFARDLESSIEIIDAVDFGDTGDIVGCYKILAALRLMCQWAEETFLHWFSDMVLRPE